MVACSSVIKYISRHFSSIDSNNLLSLPLEILHTIISSDELVIESEDSLFEFTQKPFKNRSQNQADEEEFDIVSFYEEVEFTRLSDSKFREFVENFSGSEMTAKLWRRLSSCFKSNTKKQNKNEVKKDRYTFKGKKIEYDGDTSHSSTTSQRKAAEMSLKITP